MSTFTIELDEDDGIGLVIACGSGVKYSNQTSGLACHHPELEGVFVPLTSQLGVIINALEEYFTGPKWKGRCDSGIDVETADFIDALLRKHNLDGCMDVDRNRLAESCEAWIHMKVGLNGLNWPGFEGGSGVLTWPNSD